MQRTERVAIQTRLENLFVFIPLTKRPSRGRFRPSAIVNLFRNITSTSLFLGHRQVYRHAECQALPTPAPEEHKRLSGVELDGRKARGSGGAGPGMQADRLGECRMDGTGRGHASAFSQPVGLHPRAGSAGSAGLPAVQLDSAQPLVFLRGGRGKSLALRMPIDLPMPEKQGGRCDVAEKINDS